MRFIVSRRLRPFCRAVCVILAFPAGACLRVIPRRPQLAGVKAEDIGNGLFTTAVGAVCGQTGRAGRQTVLAVGICVAVAFAGEQVVETAWPDVALLFRGTLRFQEVSPFNVTGPARPVCFGVFDV